MKDKSRCINLVEYGSFCVVIFLVSYLFIYLSFGIGVVIICAKQSCKLEYLSVASHELQYLLSFGVFVKKRKQQCKSCFS